MSGNTIQNCLNTVGLSPEKAGELAGCAVQGVVKKCMGEGENNGAELRKDDKKEDKEDEKEKEGGGGGGGGVDKLMSFSKSFF